MGVAGSGKSTLGAALAGRLNCPFLEGDDFHSPEAIARMRAGVPLTDDDRWPWLGRLGQAISADLARSAIAVATCSALRRAYRNCLREIIAVPVRFVLLDIDSGELSRRVIERKNHYMAPSLLVSQLETLERPQSDEEAITLDARHSSVELCEQIVEWLSNPGK
jgi:gluconokinase